jgi:predicted DNA-binding transcriptional regulator AlpA
MENKEVKYLNIDQYAEYRGVSRQTIYNWMKDKQDSNGNKLPMEEIAGKKLFKI